MWRTEEVGVEDVVGLLYVGQVTPRAVTEAGEVVEGMIAYLVSSSPYFVEQMGILHRIVTHHEECCLYLEAVQCVEDKRSGLRYRTIVEGKVNNLLVGVYPPQGMGV